MIHPHTGPGAAGSFGNDPASQEFIAEMAGHRYSSLIWHYGQFGPQDVHVHSCEDESCDWVLVGPSRDCAGLDDHEAHRLRSSPVGLRKRTVRHSARLRIELDVDCPGDPRALVKGMLREYRATIPAWRWVDE